MLVAMKSVGLVFFNVPSGLFVSRFGVSAGMMAGLGLWVSPVPCRTGLRAAFPYAWQVLMSVAMALTPNTSFLGVACTFSGVGLSLYRTSRQVLVAGTIPKRALGKVRRPCAQRGPAAIIPRTSAVQVNSLIGTVQRVGSFAGPLAGGIISNWMGFRTALMFQALLSAIAVLLTLLSLRPPAHATSAAVAVAVKQPSGRWFERLRSLLRTHWRAFGGAGVFCVVMQACAGVSCPVYPPRLRREGERSRDRRRARCGALQALRGAREIVLPLQGSALALTAVEVGTVVRLYARWVS